VKRRCAWAALLLRPARRPGGRAGRAWIAHNVVDHQSVPDEQHDHRADGRADQAGALVEPVPTDGLADEGGEEGAGNAEQRRQDEAFGLVRPRRQEASVMPAMNPIRMIQMMFDTTISCTHVFARVTRTSILRAGDAA
jgi:hypothetical protein